LALSEHANIYVATADTYGNAKAECDRFNLKTKLLLNGNTRIAKCELVNELNPQTTVCFGNGYNDEEMLNSSILSIGILGEEGIYASLFSKCDVIVKSIENGLDLFLKPSRLIAILRD